MGHKVHPKIFRVQGIQDWLSRWMSFSKTLRVQLEQDFRIRRYFKQRFRDYGIDSVEIERSGQAIKVMVNTARPGMLIGRGGEAVEKIRKDLLLEIAKTGAPDSKDLKIEIVEIKDPWSKAGLVAQWIARQLEKRTSHRRVLKQALSKVLARKEVKGVKLEVAGRLDGAEIARKSWLQKGQLPRQTLRADIDYAEDKAICTYGAVGVKVWLYKGDKL